MIAPIEPGTVHRYQCQKCDREFEITLEPKISEMENPPELANATP